MRKIYMILLATVCIAGCKQAEIVFPEEGTANREAVDCELKIANIDGHEWAEGDKLSVIALSAADQNQEFIYTDSYGDGGIFKGKVANSSTLCVFYPYNENSTISTDGSQVVFNANIPSEQDGTENSACYIARANSGEIINLTCITAKVKVSLTSGQGDTDIKKITVSGANSEDFAGNMSIMTFPGIEPILISPTSSGNTAIQVSKEMTLTSEAQDIYVNVIPQTLKQGYTVSATTTTDDTFGCTCEEELAITKGGDNRMSYNLAPVYPDFWIVYTAPEKLVVEGYLTDYDAASGTGKLYFDTSEVPAKILDGSLNSAYTSVTGINIPSNITFIGERAFASLSKLSSITFDKPSSLTKIDIQGFQSCAVKNLEIPASVTYLGQGSINGNSAMESLTFEKGSKLQELAKNCVNGNLGLKLVRLPATLKKVGDGAFNTKFTSPENLSFYVEATTPPTIGKNFFNKSYIPNIYVPAASLSKYQSAAGWKDYKAKIKGY